MKNPSALAVLLLSLLLVACASREPKEKGKERSALGAPEAGEIRTKKRTKDDLLSAEQLYQRARTTLDSSDFVTAVEEYDSLSTRFPFSDLATQGELERLYALYRSFEPDRMLSSADRFLREHPRHPRIDYVQYLKGLTNFSRDDSALALLPVDESRADVTALRRAWDDFAVLLQKYPDSSYNGDAWQRMVFIRNRLAEHELHVVDFYLRRGAFVAAAKRAEQVIAQYPGTPSSRKALDVLETSYIGAGMTTQADDARRLIAAQTPLSGAASPAAKPLSTALAQPPKPAQKKPAKPEVFIETDEQGVTVPPVAPAP